MCVSIMIVLCIKQYLSNTETELKKVLPIKKAFVLEKIL